MTAHLENTLVLELDTQAYVHGNQLIMSIPAAHNLLKQLSKALDGIRSSPIRMLICRHFNLTDKALMSDCRTDYLVRARWMAIRLMRNQGMSMNEIGRELHRDHQAIRYALTELEDRCNMNPKLKQELTLLEEQMKEQA